MNYLHSTRNQSPKGSMVKHMVQYAFFFLVCIWILYQMRHSLYLRSIHGCDNVEIKLKEGHFGKLLGRKVDAGSSKELDLYGIDLIGAVEKIKHDAAPDDKDNIATDWRALGEFSTKDQGAESELITKTEGNKVNSKMGATILKSDEAIRVVQFSDENGIPEHDSAPSRRSDIEVESVAKGNISSSGNQISVQGTAKERDLNKFQGREILSD